MDCRRTERASSRACRCGELPSNRLIPPSESEALPNWTKLFVAAILSAATAAAITVVILRRAGAGGGAAMPQTPAEARLFQLELERRVLEAQIEKQEKLIRELRASTRAVSRA